MANAYCKHCDRVHWEPRTVVVDDKELCTHSDAWKHECDVRFAMMLPDKARKPRITKLDYLNMVENERGSEARIKMRSEMIRRYKNGSIKNKA